MDWKPWIIGSVGVLVLVLVVARIFGGGAYSRTVAAWAQAIGAVATG